MSKERLGEICHDIFENNSITIEPEVNIREIENWDSFAHIQLMIAVEEAFCVTFSTEEVQNMGSFGELGDLIKAKGGSFAWN